MEGISWLNTLDSWSGNNYSPLDEPRAILTYLGNPQDCYKTIHIAGTNGKGSVVSYLTDILLANNPDKKIAKMISPHLFELTERAQINNINISKSALDKSILSVKKACEVNNIKPTYFVAITCAIFLAFKNLDVEIAVIETGLGGRFDVTNLITKPIATAITSIGFDHENILGKTISSICWNKAGIIKNEVPVFLGKLCEEAIDVIKKEAEEKQSEIFYTNKTDLPSNLDIKNFAGFQINNVKLATEIARYLGVTESKIPKGLKLNIWPGRFEILNRGAHNFIIDVAHNDEGLKALFHEISLLDKKKIILVLGILKRKLTDLLISTLKIKLEELDQKVDLYIYSGSINSEEGEGHIGEFANLEKLKEFAPWPKKVNMIDINNLNELKLIDHHTYIFFGSTYFYPISKNWILDPA